MRRILVLSLTLLLSGWLQAQSGAEQVEEIRRAIERLKVPPVRGWESIAWVPSLVEARKQSVAEKRPIFLFTLEGNLNSGRC